MPLLHVSALRFMVSGSQEQGESKGVCVLLLLHGALTRKHHPNPWCSPPTGGPTVPVSTVAKISKTTVALPWWVRRGKVPLQTLRIPIEYGFAESRTVSCIIGGKVWMNRGNAPENSRPREERRPRRDRNDGGGPGGAAPRGGRARRSMGDGAPAAAPA